MQFEDKTLSCRDCHQPFTFTAGEQDFFALRQLMNEPKRCPNCRLLVRLQKTGKDPSQCTEVPCDDCGAATRIPFSRLEQSLSIVHHACMSKDMHKRSVTIKR